MQPVVMAFEFGAKQRDVVPGVRGQPGEKEPVRIAVGAPKNCSDAVRVTMLLKQISESSRKYDLGLRERVGV